jgi:formate dehydrogenase major subunit
MVNLTIDGKQIEVKEGTTVLEASRQAGIVIPTLCDHPELTPYGGCRLCLVEIEGARTLQPSCTMPASNNMVVKTDTEKIHEARKFVLTMIFSERNHFCPYCQVSGGDCELQNSAYAEGMTHWPIQPNWKPYPVDASHPYIVMEHNRCILCRRCVRACGELVGNFTLGFEERGAESALVADLGLPLGESTCISCGTCVQVCPTGALIDRWSAYLGKETDVDSTKTICLGCSIGCSIDVLTRDNRLVRIEGDWEGEINDGVICDVGRFLPMNEDRDRVLTPMVRKDGTLKAATWDDALAVISEKAKASKGKVAGVASTRLSLEALDIFNQVCSELGVTSVGSTEEGLSTSQAFSILAKNGKPFEARFNDIKDASCFLTVGEDTTKDHQVVSFFVKRSLPAGAKLIQVSSVSTGFDNFANFTLRVSDDKIADFLKDFAGVVQSGTDYAKVASKFGLDEKTLKDAGMALKSTAKLAVILGSRYESSDSASIAEAAADFTASLKGKLVSTKGNINSLGASQLKVNNPVSMNGAEVVLFAAADEKLTQALMKKFEKVPFLVVFSSYATPLTASADVVLPVMNWLEQDGHFLNFDGHLLEAHASLKANENVLSNVDSFGKLAGKLNITVSPAWENALKAPSVVEISE